MDITVKKILEEFEKHASEKGLKDIDENHRNVIRQMIEAVLLTEIDQITVIPAMMGIGKSTLIKVLLDFLSNKDKRFGAVVIKERLEDMDTLRKELGYWEDEYLGLDSVFSMKGYSKNDCLEGYSVYDPANCSNCERRNCRVKNNHKEQVGYPILAISHQRLFLSSNPERCLEEYSEWNNPYDGKCKRTYIFVDEKPKFMEIKTLNRDNLDHFFNFIESITGETNMLTKLSELRLELHELFKIKQNGLVSLTGINAEEVLNHAHTVWSKYDGSNPSLLKLIESFFINGGYRTHNLKTNQVLLNIPLVTDYNFNGFKTIVFDGTATDDLGYPEKFIKLEIPDIREYQNVTIHWCNRMNLSINRLRNSNLEVIRLLKGSIQEIALMGKTLIVCHNEYEKNIRNILNGIENIEIDHFNNLKGKNSYRECSNVVFLGTFHKPDNYYLQKALYIDKEKVDNFEMPRTSEGNVREFPDAFVTSVMKNDKELDLLQDIFRIAIRDISFKGDANIYLFNTDKDIIAYMSSVLKGCTVKEWEPFEKEETYKDKFVSTLVQALCIDGIEKVSTTKHRELVGCQKSIWSRYANDIDVILEMASHGIIRTGNSFTLNEQ
ncbi:hypothetical protein FRZ06_04170 [Anoxybacterium hadale]|uniref:Uncharacterized protein n=1 Tax=Anoxybacterium hadale TaxID=3408580 RepID=A0ACD1A817_9FIRM|nr:hypothetical protein FRZ06_04170 [Clostridiales bacterium]